MVNDLRRVKQRIKSLLLCYGAAEPLGLETWSQKAMARLERAGLSGLAGITLRSMVRELRFVAKELGRIDQELKRLAGLKRHHLKVKAMRTIPGVGPVAAVAFCLEIFRPQRFNRPEELSAYLGLAPTVRQSGQGKERAGIVPAGQKRLRSILVEAAWTFKRYDPQAGEMYNRLLDRSGVARKPAIIMW